MINTVTLDEINELYSLILKNNTHEYNNRYSKTKLPENKKNWKWDGKDFPRIPAILEFERYVEKYNLKSNHLLSFNSYDDPEIEYLAYEKMTNFNYEDNKIDYDLHTLNIPKSDYDFVLLNQTIEHLYNPHLCLHNIYEVLSDGAYIYANMPTVNKQHTLPLNFTTGLTPIGLATLFKSVGFEVLEVGQWGNPEYIYTIFSPHCPPFYWPDYNVLSSTVNNFNTPAQCWILARKAK